MEPLVTGQVEPLGPLMQGLLETPGLTVAGQLVHGQVKEAPLQSTLIFVFSHTVMLACCLIYQHMELGDLQRAILSQIKVIFFRGTDLGEKSKFALIYKDTKCYEGLGVNLLL